MGLTNQEQSIALLISSVLIALSGITLVETDNIYFSLALAIAGAIGFALKEWAGGTPPK